jgi:hypothetical protein
VTCSVPSLRLVVPSFAAATAARALALPSVVSGGQAPAQAPVQLLLDPVSPRHR